MKGFGHQLRIVTVVHVVIVLGIFSFSGCRALFRPKPPQTIPIEFTVDVPRATADLPEERAENVVLPVPPPVRDAPPIVMPDKAVPSPKPPRRKIETSHKRVARGADTERETRLTPEEIERLLAEGARPSDTTRIPDSDARGFACVRAAFYQVWVQPSRTEVGDDSAEAMIVLGTGGRVISGRLSRPSGNAVLDNSVRRALNAVTQVTGLPRGFVERHREISVAFRVE
ncbi:MAG: TonB C-terminal domain-containing protein [Lentisphaerae bacterium]|nr:TonB C-terminal domain-containing protein [Lentisphaerota bacterium]